MKISSNWYLNIKFLIRRILDKLKSFENRRWSPSEINWIQHFFYLMILKILKKNTFYKRNYFSNNDDVCQFHLPIRIIKRNCQLCISHELSNATWRFTWDYFVVNQCSLFHSAFYYWCVFEPEPTIFIGLFVISSLFWNVFNYFREVGYRQNRKICVVIFSNQ